MNSNRPSGSGAAVEVQPVTDAGEWDQFVKSMTGDVIQQSHAWASAKGSTATVLGARRHGQLVGGCLFLSQSVGPVHVEYAPRGPLLAPGHEDAAVDLVQAVDTASPAWRPGVTIVQPADQPAELAAALEGAGYSMAPVDITTPATVEIDLEPDVETLFANLRSSRRRNIRKAEKAGLKVRRGDRSDLESFLTLHRNTAERQGFQPLSSAYLQAQWNELADAEMFAVYLTELDGEPMSAATVTTFGDRSVFKLAGLSSDPAARETRASDYLHWMIMKDAKERGFRFYDLGGFDKAWAKTIVAGGEPPEEIRQSASQFKLGFGGTVRSLPDAWWKLRPGPARFMQAPVANAVRNSSRLHEMLMKFRD